MGPLRESSGEFNNFRHPAGACRASMGPLRESSGEVGEEIMGERVEKLQWGRCVKAAESQSTAAGPAGGTRASMGPLRESSGEPSLMVETRLPLIASMGPLRESSGESTPG